MKQSPNHCCLAALIIGGFGIEDDSFIQAHVAQLLCSRHCVRPESSFLDLQTTVEAQRCYFQETDLCLTYLTWQLNINFISIFPSNLISISYFSIVLVIEELALVQPLKDNSFLMFYSGLQINHIVSFQIVQLYYFPRAQPNTHTKNCCFGN